MPYIYYIAIIEGGKGEDTTRNTEERLLLPSKLVQLAFLHNLGTLPRRDTALGGLGPPTPTINQENDLTELPVARLMEAMPQFPFPRRFSFVSSATKTNQHAAIKDSCLEVKKEGLGEGPLIKVLWRQRQVNLCVFKAKASQG